MCVIVVKPKNASLDEQTFKRCFTNNPDGCGFMYVENNRVVGRKGIMTYDDFKQINETLPKDRTIIYHFRISTHGGVTPSLTHPFPLSADFNKLHSLSWDNDVGVVHNGIFSALKTPEGESDTEIFITNILKPLDELSKYKKIKITDKYFKDIIENCVGTSRLVILDKSGDYTMYGSGWIQHEGCYFSNSSYSYDKYAYSYGYSNKKSKTYSSYNDNSYDNKYDYVWDTKTKIKSVNKLIDKSTVKHRTNPDMKYDLDYMDNCVFDDKGKVYYYSKAMKSYVDSYTWSTTSKYDKNEEFIVEVI